MPLVNVTPTGDVKLPIEVLNLLGLEQGGTIQIRQAENGEITVRKADEATIRKANIKALHKAQAAFAGMAEELDMHNESDVQALVDEVRYGAKR